MAKVKMGLSGLSVPELIERTRLITGSMTGNPNYTTPSPALADVNTAADDTELAYNESRGRDKDKVALMRLRVKALKALLLQLAGYVQQASENDEEKILSSGFDVVGPKVPKPDIAGPVTNVRLFDGSIPGRVKVDWNKAANAVIYIVESSLTPEFSNSDANGCTTRTSKEVGEFASGIRIWIRVVALGRENRGPYSDPISILVK